MRALRSLLVYLALAAFVAPNAFAIHARGGGSASVLVGYWPLSHSLQMQPMQALYPSSSAQPWAAADYAYYNPTAGVAFYPSQRVGVSFGRWPFVYSLLSGPPGMFIGAPTWNIAWYQNIAGFTQAAWNNGYGQVQWTPNASNTNNCVTGNGWTWTGGCTGTGIFTAGVEVQVCDQNNQGGTSSCVDISWPLEIKDSQFYFVNADTSSPLNGNAGNDTSGCGTLTAPCATIGYAAGINGAAANAPAGSIVILRGANTEYTFPATASGGGTFNPNGSTGPASFIGMPGDSGAATVDLINAGSSASQVPNSTTNGSAVTPGSTDIFFGNLALNGYGGYGGASSITATISNGSGGSGNILNVSAVSSGSVAVGEVYNGTGVSNVIVTGEVSGIGQTGTYTVNTSLNVGSETLTGSHQGPSVSNFRPFVWTVNPRQTYQNIVWNNAGYGVSAANNASMFYEADASITSYSEDDFVTGVVENGRQAQAHGGQVNDAGMMLLFGSQNALVELTEVDTVNAVGNVYYPKGDVSDTCIRANLAIVGSGNSAYETSQSLFYAMDKDEISYNLAVGSFNSINIADTPPAAWGQIDLFRNNFITSSLGFNVPTQAADYNLVAPYTYFNTNAGGGSMPAGFLTITAPIITTTGGTLSGTIDYAITTEGVTGESALATGQGNSTMPITFTGSTNQVELFWYGAIPYNNGYKLYRDTTGTGNYTQYIALAANTSNYTDTGTSVGWTSCGGTCTIPSTSTAVSSARLLLDSNLMQTPTQSADPSGPTIASGILSGLGATSDKFATSGLLNTTTGLQVTSTYLCTRGAETGC